jgi:FMN phosphatase YigB (HAD superfamily)
MKVDLPKQAENEKVLCHLSDDWKTRKSEGPRSKGETLSYRYGVSATPNSWALTEYRENLAFNQVYATSFADLAPSFRTIANVDPVEGMKRVIASLERITGKKIVLSNSGANEIEKALEMGRQVDAFFEVDYAIHDRVRERIFGDGGTEDES